MSEPAPIAFHSMADRPAPRGEVVLVRGGSEPGKYLYALAKHDPAPEDGGPTLGGWQEWRCMLRRDVGDSFTRLWFTPTAWAMHDKPDPR